MVKIIPLECKSVWRAGLWLWIFCAAVACQQPPTPTALPGTTVSYAVATITDVMVEDVTNPPLAARFFTQLQAIHAAGKTPEEKLVAAF